MKQILLVFALLTPVVISGQSPSWRIYPSIGIDMGGTIPFPFSDMPEGLKGTPRLNPNLGLGFEHSLADKWDLAIEMNYHVLAFSATADVKSQAYHDIYFTGHTSTAVELRFVEIPVILFHEVNDRWSLILGAYYSRVPEGTFTTSLTKGIFSNNKAITDTATHLVNYDPPINYSYSNSIDKWDAGVLFGYRYALNHRLFFWGRLHIGLKSIFVSEFSDINYDMYQVRLNAGISVILFSNRTE
jgi:hypothetical protein